MDCLSHIYSLFHSIQALKRVFIKACRRLMQSQPLLALCLKQLRCDLQLCAPSTFVFYLERRIGEDTEPCCTDADLPFKMYTSSFNFSDHSPPADSKASVEAALLGTALANPLISLFLECCNHMFIGSRLSHYVARRAGPVGDLGRHNSLIRHDSADNHHFRRLSAF